MIKCVLVDDELPTLAYLQALCAQIADIEVVKSFNNPTKFLNQLSGLDFNTCILDITMPGINGMELARQLQGKAIVFSTAHKEYAAEAYDLDAVDYLRKPYQLERLGKAFEKVKIWLSAQQQLVASYIEVNTDRGKARINTGEVVYITVAENDRRDKVIALKNGVQHLAKNITFDQLLALAPDTLLVRINRSTLVSPDTVVNYTASWVRCQGAPDLEPEQFPLTDQYRADFLTSLPG